MYYPEEILLHCVTDLNRPDASSMERMRHYRPWELLLLLKWAIIYGDHISPDRRHLKEPDFIKLVNLLFQFGADIRTPDQYNSVLLFLRNMAFQQFWLQERARSANLARQSILFRKLPPNHSLQVTFADKAGLSVDQFILLANVLLTGFLTHRKEPFVTEQFFSPISKHMGVDAVRSFLALLSKDFNSLRLYLEQPEMSRLGKAYEIYEQTPLRRYPLLLLNHRYYTYSPIVLFHGLQSFVFDILRESNPSGFMDHFGPIFEKYIKRGLEHAHLNFVSESELRTVLPRQNKVVDFFFTDGGTNIILEAKGIEMPPIGMITHLPDVIRDRTKTSIIKAIEQAHESWAHFHHMTAVGKLPVQSDVPFLLVVTFKDLYVGNGSDFVSSVATDLPPSLAARFSPEDIIHPERMYFLSIEDFDFLVEAARRGTSISSILHAAVKADSDPKTKRFVFRQHVREAVSSIGIPDYLEREFAEIMDRIISWVDKPGGSPA
jgi:hypothetical protein